MREDQKPVAMNPWRPISNPFHIRRLGKLQEELAELQKIVARCLIQGLDGADPATGEPNLQALWKEAADVNAQIEVTTCTFDLPRIDMVARAYFKRQRMDDWERVLAAEPDRFPYTPAQLAHDHAFRVSTDPGVKNRPRLRHPGEGVSDYRVAMGWDIPITTGGTP